MAVNAHTAANTIRAMAPKNLRVRMVIAEMSGIVGEGAACADGAADYKGHENSFKFHVR